MAVTNEIATAMESLDQLPAALLDTIMTKLDVSSICSVASTCTLFKACAAHILSFIPSFHLLVRISIFNFAQFEKTHNIFKIEKKNWPFWGFSLGNCAFNGIVEASVAAEPLVEDHEGELWPAWWFGHPDSAAAFSARALYAQLRRFQRQIAFGDRRPMQGSEVGFFVRLC